MVESYLLFLHFEMVESGIYVQLGSLVLLSCKGAWKGLTLNEPFNVVGVVLMKPGFFCTGAEALFRFFVV